ncbi:MAG: biotin--[acetyl-CoA-carboxylase] ligase [Ruminococcaceae bacterium]|nr:biotin--[acetyl-CoA-carboxylase] ligase [Oscillospiraceae bacterium]
MPDFVAVINKIKTELCHLGVRFVTYESIGSTNAEAKAYATYAADTSPVLFLAKEQSAGRGRLGRNFVSRGDCGIYMTLLYFTSEELCSAVTVTTATAVAAASAIKKASGKKVGIKWANDIYSDEGKVAGILVETVPTKCGYAIAVGIGINIGDTGFPPEIADIAASLGEIDAKSAAELITIFCEQVLSHAKDHKSREYMSEYRRMFMLKDKTVDLYVSGEKVMRGVVTGVDDEGALLVLPHGEREVKSFYSGEITVRIVQG